MLREQDWLTPSGKPPLARPSGLSLVHAPPTWKQPGLPLQRPDLQPPPSPTPLAQVQTVAAVSNLQSKAGAEKPTSEVEIKVLVERPPVSQASKPSNSADKEAGDALLLAQQWSCDVWSSCKNFSVVIKCLGADCEEAQAKKHLVSAFASASGTLRRHRFGWETWMAHARAHDWHVADGNLLHFSDFCLLLVEGAEEGCKRLPSAETVIEAVGFAARRGHLQEVATMLQSPVISGYKKNKAPRERNEAAPFSACALFAMEEALLQGRFDLHDSLLLGFALLCAWAGLRFGDGQRTKPGSLSLQGYLLFGSCWKTKSCDRGQPFACMVCGMTRSEGKPGWGHIWLGLLQEWLASIDNDDRQRVDYLLPGRGQGNKVLSQPCSYWCFATRLRQLLLELECVDADKVTSYRPHGLKCTFIAWSLQAPVSEVIPKQVPKDWAAAQGHHRGSAKAQQAALYSRNDVWDALLLQQTVLEALRDGWRPRTSQMRGGAPNLVEKFSLTVVKYPYMSLQQLEDVEVKAEAKEPLAPVELPRTVSRSPSAVRACRRDEKRVAQFSSWADGRPTIRRRKAE